MNVIKTILLGTFILVCSVCRVAYANDPTSGTGNELIKHCNNANYQAQNTEWDYCLAYIDGVTDGYIWSGSGIYAASQVKGLSLDAKIALDKLFETFEHLECQPANATREQVALVVSKYLAENPEMLNQSASDLVMGAVMKAWPCQKNNT